MPYLLQEKQEQKSNLNSIFFYEYHSLIFVPMFFIGILLFVLSLEKGSYRYQFQRLGFSLLTLMTVFLCPASVFYSIQKGLFWFLIPQILVIVNELTAQTFDFFFGITPLIMLAPRKTVQGFIAGVFATLTVAFYVRPIHLHLQLSDYLSQSKFMVCPQSHLTFEVFPKIDCQIPHEFQQRIYTLPFSFMGQTQVNIRPSQIHALIIAAFACLVAPFVGFLI